MPNLMYQNKPLFHYESTGYLTPCWIWDRTLVHGYGQTRIVGADGLKNVAIYAHVWLWNMVNEPVPDGLQLDHLCKIRKCCRPDHLEIVTNAENVRRSSKAKLTYAAVAEIRTNMKSGLDYAAQFSVSPQAISHVKRGKTWTAK